MSEEDGGMEENETMKSDTNQVALRHAANELERWARGRVGDWSADDVDLIDHVRLQLLKAANLIDPKVDEHSPDDDCEKRIVEFDGKPGYIVHERTP